MDKEKTLLGLKVLVDSISSLHKDICSEWGRYADLNGIFIFNQKKQQICDIPNDRRLMDTISKYADFLNGCRDKLEFDDKQYGFTVNSRVKNINSIEEKWTDYLSFGPERGKVSINKCFNDLFGIRAIVDCNDLSYLDIDSKLCDRRELSSIQKNKENPRYNTTYRATHIYFKEDNYSFKWELQIWKSSDER